MTAPLIKLNNGCTIPAVGLGTWQLQADQATSVVAYAIKEAGYRHVDCAWAYDNEKEVGQGIRESGVPRSEIFITSKLWSTFHSKVEEGLDQSLASLGMDYLDLYLIHWPVPLNPNGNHPVFPTRSNGVRDVDESVDLRETWRQMDDVQKKGKVKSIGVSNFSEAMLEKILPTASIVPVIDQLEIHPYNPQHTLLSYLSSKHILPSAFSPLGSTNSPLLSDPTAMRIAERRGIAVADVLLGWLVSKSIIPLPKSTSPSHIKSNLLGATTQVLTKEDVEELDGVAEREGRERRFVMPPWPVPLGFENWPQTVFLDD